MRSDDEGGLDPRSEALSLREHPLPSEVSGDDKILPTRIAILDNEIAKTAEHLKDLQSSRVLLLDHAIKNDILEDDKYRIDKEVIKGNRVASLEKLREMFPVQYESYLLAIKDKLTRDFKADAVKAADKMLKVVNLSVADAIFGKENVTRCSEIPERIEYRVVKKNAGR